MNKNTTQKGFTLIELLVVIAVIGILSGIVLASLNSARGKSRDAKRVSDLKQIQTALEMYYHTYGSYPQCNGNDFCTSTGAGGSDDISALSVVPTFIPKIDKDPKNEPRNFGYYYVRGYLKYISNGTTCYRAATGDTTQYYVLAARLEGVAGNAIRLNCINSGIYDNSSANYLVGN